MDYWNIYWSNAILYKSAGEPVRTAGTSSGVMESNVSDGGPVCTTGTSAGVMESSIKVLENQLGLLEHQLELWNRP